MNKHMYLIITFVFIASCKSHSISYFDQNPPSNIPKLFAPGVVNTDNIELNVVFNSVHTELFFSRIVDGSFVIYHSELKNGKWSEIKPLQLYNDDILVSVACDPTITKDGKTMYFLGVDPKLYDAQVTREELFKIPPDIYMSRKIDGTWQAASKVSFPISTEFIETYPVVTANGSLYFRSNRPNEKKGMQTYTARLLETDEFEAPRVVNIPTENNELISYISPDEQFAITNGQGKFQITFQKNGKWSRPQEILLSYEDNWRYYAPYMTADGKYFIFSRRYNNPNKKGWAGVEKGEVYWVSAELLFNFK